MGNIFYLKIEIQLDMDNNKILESQNNNEEKFVDPD